MTTQESGRGRETERREILARVLRAALIGRDGGTLYANEGRDDVSVVVVYRDQAYDVGAEVRELLELDQGRYGWTISVAPGTALRKEGERRESDDWGVVVAEALGETLGGEVSIGHEVDFEYLEQTLEDDELL